MNDQDLALYTSLTDQVHQLEGKLEAVRKDRQKLAGRLIAENGKGHVYVIGDQEYIIRSSKTDTHFFTPVLHRRKAVNNETSTPNF